MVLNLSAFGIQQKEDEEKKRDSKTTTLDLSAFQSGESLSQDQTQEVLDQGGEVLQPASAVDTSNVRGRFLRRFRSRVKDAFTPDDVETRRRAGIKREETRAIERGTASPLIIAGQPVAVAPSNIFSETSKDFIETPERVVRGIADVFHKPTEKEIEQRIRDPYKVKTYLDIKKLFQDDVSANGLNDSEANILSSIYAGSLAVLDVAFIGGIVDDITKSARNLDAVAPNDVTHVDAWQALGRPQTVDDAVKNARDIQKIVHPDIPVTGNTQMSAVTNDALSIIRKKGIPSSSATKNTRSLADILQSEVDVETLLRNPFEAIKPPAQKAPVAQFRKALPGTVETPGQGMPFGLSIRQVERVGGQKVAQKFAQASTADDFAKSLSRSEKSSIKNAGYTAKALYELGKSAEDVPEVLFKEAQKFDNPDEFIDKVRGSATQYGEYTPEIRLGGSYPDQKRLDELGVDPEEFVTIYRGIDDFENKITDKKINNGDFVTTDFDSALSYTDSPDNVVSKEVLAKDLILESDERDFLEEPFFIGSEYIYSESKNPIMTFSDEGLRSIWENARKPVDTTPKVRKMTRSKEIPSLEETARQVLSGEKGEALAALDESIVAYELENSFTKEFLDQNPAKALTKYAHTRGEFKGRLPEVTGDPDATSRFARQGDDIAGELGFDDSEEARQAYEDYRERKEEYDASVEYIKDLKRQRKVLSSELKTGENLARKSLGVGANLMPKTPEATKAAIGILENMGAKELTTKAAGLGAGSKLPFTSKIKATEEYQKWVGYVEENIIRDIKPAVLTRHVTMTAERVAEFLDNDEIAGEVYRQIIKPVYDKAEELKLEANNLKQEIDSFNIVEGTTDARDASLYAQGKLETEPSDQVKAMAEYARNKYDEYLDRLNEIRERLDVAPIPKRKDYVTHLNELRVMSELYGGIDRDYIAQRISDLKQELVPEIRTKNPDWSDDKVSQVAFERAKKQVEGTQGIEMFVDRRQPVFKFAKERFDDYEANPDIIASLRAYSQDALRYIYQADNVARNKAFIDPLPANAKTFLKTWNSTQVAGGRHQSIIDPVSRRIITAIRNTLGSNTIMGNVATMAMQLTSFPAVFAMAGVRNTVYGITKRLVSYVNDKKDLYQYSRTRTMRNLNTDIGVGESLVDSLLKQVGKIERAKNPAARTRQAIQFGRTILSELMEKADAFTVGATYESFYRKATLDGLAPTEAREYADIMTGKTQANYFPEGKPLFLDKLEGQILGQFGTYGFNQWQMFKRDFGKDFKFNAKSERSAKEMMKQFIKFLVASYLIDTFSEYSFGRQPFEVKDLVDTGIEVFTEDRPVSALTGQTRDTVLNYVPFLSSVKFNSLPPVLELGKDILQATLGTGTEAERARENMLSKWSFNIFLPYAGNQLRKSLEGTESVTGINLPVVNSTASDKFEIQGGFEQTKAVVFGPWSTQPAQEYFEQKERKDEIKKKYGIAGNITADENIEALKEMTNKEYSLYIQNYATSTKESIQQKTGRKIRGLGQEIMQERMKEKQEEILERTGTEESPTTSSRRSIDEILRQ